MVEISNAPVTFLKTNNEIKTNYESKIIKKKIYC